MPVSPSRSQAALARRPAAEGDIDEAQTLAAREVVADVVHLLGREVADDEQDAGVEREGEEFEQAVGIDGGAFRCGRERR
jgi:hypothetical protein